VISPTRRRRTRRSAKPAIPGTLSPERVAQTILLVRGQRVVLDVDIAVLYGVETKELNRAVRRNARRFPDDFMFQLTARESVNLRFQSGTSSWGGRRYRPFAFTEQGVAMLSGVLRSTRAIEVNIAIMRAFCGLRQVLASHEELARKLTDLERRMTKHDSQLQVAFDAIRRLMLPPAGGGRPPIGFRRSREASGEPASSGRRRGRRPSARTPRH
jgi:hypothetical protein